MMILCLRWPVGWRASEVDSWELVRTHDSPLMHCTLDGWDGQHSTVAPARAEQALS